MGITVEQYNAAIGSDGTVDPDAYNSEYETTYIWEFSNGDKLSATFSEYSKVSIEVKNGKIFETMSFLEMRDLTLVLMAIQ